MKSLRPIELLVAVALAGAVVLAPTNGAVLMSLVVIQAAAAMIRSPLALFAFALMVPVSPYPIFGVPALAWAVAAGWFAVGCRRAALRGRRPLDRRQKVALVLAAGVLISATAHGVSNAFAWWIVLELALLPLAFALLAELWEPTQMRRCIAWFGCGLAVAAGQSLRDLLAVRAANIEQFLQTRHLVALAGGSNYVAAILTVCGLFFVAVAIARGRLAWASAALGAACLLAPFIVASRASFVGLVAGMGVLVVLRRKTLGGSRRRWVAAALCLLLLVGVFSQTGEFLRSRLRLVAEVGLAERGPLFQASADIFRDNPVDGVGPGNVRGELAERQLFFESSYSHNIVLSLLGQLGALLGGLYLWLLWPFRSWVLKNEILAPMLVAGFVISLGEVGVESVRMGLLYALSLSGAAAAGAVQRGAAPKPLAVSAGVR